MPPTFGHHKRRLLNVHTAVASNTTSTAAAAAEGRQLPRSRVVVAGMTQEVAHQNPVPSTIADFGIARGAQLLDASPAQTYIGGAVAVLAPHNDIELLPILACSGPSAGVLEHASFLQMAQELLQGIQAAATDTGGVDGVYLSLHGAMATDEEQDPEGHLLEELRKIVGDTVPITISVDLHGIMTAKMCRHASAICALHTYPHIDGTAVA